MIDYHLQGEINSSLPKLLFVMMFITAAENNLEQKLVPEVGCCSNKPYLLCVGNSVACQTGNGIECSELNGLICESLEDNKDRLMKCQRDI